MGERFQLKISGEEVNKGLKDFLAQIMEKHAIENIIVPILAPSKNSIFPTLVRDKELLEYAKPVAPVLAVSTATVVSKMTKLSASPKEVVVFLKPCELRALLELAKFKQVTLENLILVSYDCMGAYKPEVYDEEVSEGKNVCDEYASENLMKGVVGEHMRDACTMCKDFHPGDSADITVGFLGTGGEVIVEAGSAKGEKLLADMGLEKIDTGKRDEELEKAGKAREEKWVAAKEATKKEVTGIEALVTYFAKCIDCHNCMGQCPICFCKECFWESPTFEFSPQNFLGWAEKRGAVKLPTDTTFFHLGRLTHMSTSCVACGLCSDACPRDIKVYELFHLVADETQAAFEYKPGRDLEEEAPLVTFKEDELQELG
jgi:formate dehydrogenase subunit beta